MVNLSQMGEGQRRLLDAMGGQAEEDRVTVWQVDDDVHDEVDVDVDDNVIDVVDDEVDEDVDDEVDDEAESSTVEVLHQMQWKLSPPSCLAAD